MFKSTGELLREQLGLPNQQNKDVEVKEPKVLTEDQKKYWNKVDNFDSNKCVELSEKDLKKRFMIHASQLVRNTSNLDQFVIDQENKELLQCLTKYFTKDESFKEFKCVFKKYKESDGSNIEIEPSIKKGLMIVGNYGFGKTIIFKAFQKSFLPINSSNRFGIVSSKEIVSYYHNTKEPDLKKYYNSTWYFDDVGHEKAAYGKDELMEDIIFQRYHLFQNKGNKTHISTNYDLEYLKSKYGDYIYSRIFEMFNIIFVDGRDRRKS